MDLVSVDSASASAQPGLLTLSLTVVGDDKSTQTGFPYGWSAGIDDPAPLYRQITDWMNKHPSLIAAPYVEPAPPMPDLLPYQFRAMLALSGHQSALDAYVAGLPDPQKTIAQAKLDYSLAFQRDNSLVLAAQQALGLTDAQLDALWTQAAAIV